MLLLTDEDIQEDIRGFERRIQEARDKFSELPTGHLAYPQHKKREKQRRDLQAEIKHVQGLILIAKEALTDQDLSYYRHSLGTS